jgi:hypothetical protein
MTTQGSGRGTTGAEDAQGTPIQSHISPGILVYKDNTDSLHDEASTDACTANVPTVIIIL